MKKVFLGGTAARSKWREKLIPMLQLGYFNPVVDDWNEEAMKREIRERQDCDFVLYVITPESEGYYAIAEVVDDSNKRPEKTIFCFLDEAQGFTEHQLKSLHAVGRLVEENGGLWLQDLQEVAITLNRENS